MIKAKIFVTLKDGILDPQGRAVQQSLLTLGFSSVDNVRIGKFLEVDVQETEKSAAEIQIKSMCEKLLANPVIENYRYELFDSQQSQLSVKGIFPVNMGVIVFPGSNCDRDCAHVVSEVMGQSVDPIWHRDTSLRGMDAIILPGGFSYGDYLRTGAIAHLSPIMEAVKTFVEQGGLVLGICNGFQILLESGLLPGALLRNRDLSFICEEVYVRVENADTPFTNRYQPGQVLKIPIAHAEGNYYTDPVSLSSLQANNQVVFRYCDQEGRITPESNPNGALDNIAGIRNAAGNVLGMMPHPERCSESILRNTDGLAIFQSIVASFTNQSSPSGCQPAYAPPMEVFPGVSMNQEVCAGKPCLADTSIDVATVVGMLGTGKSLDEVKEMFQLTQEQIFTALRYASYVTDHLPLRMPP